MDFWGANFTTTNRPCTTNRTEVFYRCVDASCTSSSTIDLGRPDFVGSNGWRGWCFLSEKSVVFFFSGDPKRVTWNGKTPPHNATHPPWNWKRCGFNQENSILHLTFCMQWRFERRGSVSTWPPTTPWRPLWWKSQFCRGHRWFGPIVTGKHMNTAKGFGVVGQIGMGEWIRAQYSRGYGCFRKWWYPPNHPILIGFSIIFTIHFGVPLFSETPIYWQCRIFLWSICQWSYSHSTYFPGN